MPARSTPTPWARPGWLTFFGSLPEGEVARVALARLELFSGGNELRIEIAMAKLAVLRKGFDVEPDVAQLRDVGMVGLHQARDELDDALHGASDRGIFLDPLHVQAVHDIQKRVNVLARGALGVAVLQSCAIDDLVVNIRE